MSQSDVRQFATLVVLALTATLAPVSIDMLTPSLAGMSADLNSAPRTIELSIYSFLVGYGVSPSLWGALSDRIGRRPIMFAGMTIYIVSSMSCAVTDDAALLVGVRFVQGLGGGAGATMARAIVRDIYGAAGTTRIMARMISLMAVVPFFMPLVGGLLADMISWQACFIFMALLGAISVAAYFWLVPETRPKHDKDAAPQGLSALQVLRDPVFAQHAVCNMFSISTLVIFGANFAFITHNQFQLDSASNGLVLALFNGAIALGTQWVWWLMPRFQVHGSIMVGAGSCTLGWLCIALLAQAGLATPTLLAAPLVLAAAGSGVIMALCSGAALTPFSHNTGTASSLYLLLQSIGSSAISLAVGLLLPKQLLPMAAALAVCAGMAALAKTLINKGANATAMEK